MDIGAFVLAMNNGRKYIQLTNQEGWDTTIQSGMTIVMSVIITQRVHFLEDKKYQCPFCDCWNGLKANNRKSSVDWWGFDRFIQI